jgi:hypothetical protein
MRRTEDTILQREVVSRTAQKRAPITAHGSSGCYLIQNRKSISKSSIRIFNPITTDQKILVEWVSQNQDFNDQILDNYFEGDVAIDILSGYPENVRYFYFEFDVAEDGEGT